MPPLNLQQFLGRTLFVAGLLLAAVGLLLLLAPRVPFLGRLPGDLSYQRGNLRLYVPLTTCIILSLLLTLLLTLLSRFRR
jgi:hypothetical protein